LIGKLSEDRPIPTAQARGVTARTIEWYRDRGGRIVEMFEQWGITQPEQLTRAVVSKFIGTVRRQQRNGRPLQPQTVLGYWQVGKGFVTFLIAEGVIAAPNPFDLFGKPRVPQNSMWAPSRDECVALLRIPDRRTVQGLRDLIQVLDIHHRAPELRDNEPKVVL
jgi:site-specific recombinase XerD